MKKDTIIAIDLAKKIMHVTQVNSEGKLTAQKKVRSEKLLPYLYNQNKKFIVAMEACSSCNYWTQEIVKLGFEVRIVKTKDVKAYAKSRQKNDFNDGIAIAKAAREPLLKFVRGKSKEQQDVSLTHKIRANTIRDRIKKTNSLMSSLVEYGYVTKLSKGKFCKDCDLEVKNAYEQKYISKEALDLLFLECEEITGLCNREKTLDKLIVKMNKQSERATRLQTIHGIGPINANYLNIAPIENYSTPRDFAASLGLVPKQSTSGDKVVLGSITKQGDRYARTMLIQAGRSVAIRAKKSKDSDDKLIKWAQKKFAENRPFNLICVGLANKLARIAYSVMKNSTEYRAI